MTREEREAQDAWEREFFSAPLHGLNREWIERGVVASKDADAARLEGK